MGHSNNSIRFVQARADLERKLEGALEAKMAVMEEKLGLLEEARAAEERLLQVRLIFFLIRRHACREVIYSRNWFWIISLRFFFLYPTRP